MGNQNSDTGVPQNVILPLPKRVSTNTIYSGMHWAKRNAIKDVYRRCILFFKENFKVVKEYPVDLHFVFYSRGRALDSSNCSFMGKMIEDSLVHAGILENDTIKYVNKVSYEFRHETKDVMRIVISKGKPYLLCEGETDGFKQPRF